MQKLSVLFLLSAIVLVSCGVSSEELAMQYRRASAFIKGAGVVADPEKGIALLMDAAKRGSPEAALDLGYMLLKGMATLEKSATGALMYFERAGTLGSIDGAYNAGLAYARGEGAAQNYERAFTWFQKAAEAGDSGAQFNLGLMYMRGEGVVVDLVKAHSWLSLAAMQNYAGASGALTFLEKGMSPDELTRVSAALERLQSRVRQRPPSSALRIIGPSPAL